MAAAMAAALLAGCSIEGEVSSSEAQATPSASESGEIMVEITIPASYFEGKTEEEVEEAAKAQGAASVKKLEDGSYQYEMAASAQRRLVSEMRLNLLDSVSELAGGEEYPSVQSAELSGDLSELTLVVDKAAYEKSNDKSIVRAVWPLLEVYYYCSSENPEEKSLHVTVKNAEDGEEVESFSWPEPEEEQAESAASSEAEKEAEEE